MGVDLLWNDGCSTGASFCRTWALHGRLRWEGDTFCNVKLIFGTPKHPSPLPWETTQRLLLSQPSGGSRWCKGWPQIKAVQRTRCVCCQRRTPARAEKMSLDSSSSQKWKCEDFYFILEVAMDAWWDTRKTMFKWQNWDLFATSLTFDFWTVWLSLKNEALTILGSPLQISVLHSTAKILLRSLRFSWA